MDSIGSSQLSQGQLDAARNAAALNHAVTTGEVDQSGAVGVNTRGVIPPGGLSDAAAAGTVGYGSASLDGVDWDQLAADISTTDTMNISISEIMVLLVETMSDLRKGQRDAWMGEAQNALAMGLNAADRMRESAAAKLACDCISNGTSIALACVSLGTQGASLVKEASVGKQVAQEANQKLAAQAKALGLPENEMVVQGSSNTPGKIPGLDQLDTPDTAGAQVWKDNPMYVKPDDAIKMAEPDVASGSVETPKAPEVAKAPETPKADTPLDGAKLGGPDQGKSPQGSDIAKRGGKSEAQKGSDTGKSEGFDAKKAELDAKEADIKMWETQRRAELMRPFNAKVEIVNKTAEVLGGFTKAGASAGEYMSAIKQAEAQEARSRGDYANNIAQVELDFANELRDTMRAALDAMKSVESGRHQAMQGIYNI